MTAKNTLRNIVLWFYKYQIKNVLGQQGFQKLFQGRRSTQLAYPQFRCFVKWHLKGVLVNGCSHSLRKLYDFIL